MTTSIRGYHPPFVWVANGPLTGFADGVAGTYTQAGAFDGTRDVWANLFIRYVRLRQQVDGAAGTTTVELFRNRAGVFTSLGTVSLAFGGGVMATATMTPGSTALRTLAGAPSATAGDFLAVQFNARQTVTAAGVVIEVGFQ